MPQVDFSQPKVMVSNGGPHSARRWAVVVADDIVRIESSVPDEALDTHERMRRNAARHLRESIVNSLEPIFNAVVINDRVGLSGIVDFAIDTLKGIMPRHLSDECVEGDMRDLLARHFISAIEVAASYRKDDF